MPRLEDGEFALSANKFKKRRAWIACDDVLPAAVIIDDKVQAIDIASHKPAPHKTKPQHECNKTITRIEHECNKSITRLEQKKLHINAAMQTNKTRIEHEYNKSVTRVEHEYNKTITSKNSTEFYSFLAYQKASMVSYDDEPRCVILSLSDAQKKLFWHTALLCIQKETSRTGPIEIKKFFDELNISTGVVRTTLNRLVDKRILQKEKGKLGKNGFAIISLPKTIFDAAKEIFTAFNAKKSIES